MQTVSLLMRTTRSWRLGGFLEGPGILRISVKEDLEGMKAGGVDTGEGEDVVEVEGKEGITKMPMSTILSGVLVASEVVVVVVVVVAAVFADVVG